MKGLFASKDQRLILREESIDLSRATYSEELSSTGFDAETQNFHVSIDRILFTSPVSIIQTLLEAHGYTLNLENFLACLDDLHVTVMAQTQASEQSPYIGRRYLPTLQFRLPSKLHVGPLLKKFYTEIEAYEAAIKTLKEDPKGPARSDRKEQQKEKIEALERENQDLKQQIKDLKIELQRASQSIAQVNRALSDQNLMPPEIRLATVKAIAWDERLIHLKSGRTSFHLAFIKAQTVPEVGERCLVHIDQGIVQNAFFFETKGQRLTPALATVLFTAGGQCKIRDSLRRSQTLTAKNDEERALFQRLRRHDKLLVASLGDVIVSFQELPLSHDEHFIDRMQEQLAQFEIYSANDDEE